MEAVKTNITIDQFSKDHWSLFGYVESRVHSHQIAPMTGELGQNNIRINSTKRQLATKRPWNPEWGSRLMGYWNETKEIDKSKLLPDHDDIDCLEDLEMVGLIEIISNVNLYIKLTEKGQKVASELREWKNAGNMYATFKTSI